MFCKLAIRNVTRSVRDYTMYFLTLMFGVCLFYMFNSLDSQAAMLNLSGSQQNILRSLIQAIGVVSVFISVVLGFLIVYANRFLIRRRKKELGLYMTLGMSRGGISGIVVLETFLIGLLSLAMGLLAGIFASQGLSVITAKMFEANMSAFRFTFSPGAFGKTILYFGIIFLVVILFNMLSISKLRLIDLLNASRKSEKLRISRLWISVALFLVSAGCLAAAYILIEKNGMMDFNGEFLASILLGCLGTLLFFLSLSGFLLRVVQANKKLYFKNLNMFVLRQINSKINTVFVSMSVICIMLLITIGTLSTGMGMASVLSGDLKKSTPYDISFAYTNRKTDPKAHIQDLSAALKKDGVDLSLWAKTSAQLNGYETDFTYGDLIKKSDWPDSLSSYYKYLTPVKVVAVSLSDFNRLRALNGKPPVSLKPNQYAINCMFDKLNPAYQNILERGMCIKLYGNVLAPAGEDFYKECFVNSGSTTDTGTLVVPDALLAGRVPAEQVLNVLYKPGADEAALMKKLETVYPPVKVKNGTFSRPYVVAYSRTGIQKEAAGYTALISFIAIYIGLVFLITAAAVLALQQLTEASDNVERYGLLRKLGTEEGMVNRALLTQIAIYFMLPLLLAIVHSVVGIHVANRAVALLGRLDILSNTVLTAAIFLVVYGGYFAATYLGSRNMIRQKGI